MWGISDTFRAAEAMSRIPYHVCPRRIVSYSFQKEPPGLFCKNPILKNFALVKYLCWILILIKLSKGVFQ